MQMRRGHVNGTRFINRIPNLTIRNKGNANMPVVRHLHIIFNYHRTVGMGGRWQGRFQQRYVRRPRGAGRRGHVHWRAQPDRNPAAAQVEGGSSEASVQHQEQRGIDDRVQV